MKLIIGLGNPGKKFENTRHNIGFKVIDELAQRWDLKLAIKRKWKVAIAQEKVWGAYLAKPTVFMNNSGQAVLLASQYLNISVSDIWVIHDDLDLPLGQLRIKSGGGTAGHLGLESIVKETGESGFLRFRIGIGHPGVGAGEKEVRKYVLALFKKPEAVLIKKAVQQTAEAIELALAESPAKAMNEYHQRE